MAYSDFLNLNDIKERLDINYKIVNFTKNDFIKNRQPSASLVENLAEYPLIPSLFSEKARSEFIIAPILKEVWKNNRPRITFFSGVSLDFDKKLGLNGICDFLIQKGQNILAIQYPIICLVEAKNKDVGEGVAQCIAEMYAAQQLNKQHEINIPFVYGVITDGQEWFFLRLEDNKAQIDTTRYELHNIDKILGVFDWLIDSILAHFPEED